MKRKRVIVISIAFVLALSMIGSVLARDHLILGIHPYKSPTVLVKAYTPLADYLSEHAGLPVKISISNNYASHIDTIGMDKIDIAYMGPASYVKLVEKYGKKHLIACQVVNGKSTFQGKIIVRNDSDLTSLAQLKGKSFAFGDPASTMSHLVPRYMLLRAGIKLEGLNNYKFLGSHDNVALSVLTGDYDAGAVKEAIFYKYESRGLRVLVSTPELTEHNFVARKNIDPGMVEKLRHAFHSLGKDPSGKRILESIKPGISGMKPVEDKEYENLRKILNHLRSTGVIK